MHFCFLKNNMKSLNLYNSGAWNVDNLNENSH